MRVGRALRPYFLPPRRGDQEDRLAEERAEAGGDYSVDVRYDSVRLTRRGMRRAVKLLGGSQGGH